MVWVQGATPGQGECRSKRRSSVDWMPERIGKWSVGVGRRHPVTMCKALFKTLSMRQVCALRHQTGAQYSAVKQTKDRAAVRSIVVPVSHPEPTSRLRSMRPVANFLHNVSRWWRNVNDLSSYTTW